MFFRLLAALLLCLHAALAVAEESCAEPGPLPWACECNHCTTEYRTKKGRKKTVTLHNLCQCPPGGVDGSPDYIEALAKQVKVRRPFCGSTAPLEKATAEACRDDNHWNPIEDVCPGEGTGRAVSSADCRPADSKEQSAMMACWIWRNLPGVTYRHHTNADGTHAFLLVKWLEPKGCKERYWIVDPAFQDGYVSEVGLYDGQMYSIDLKGTLTQLAGIHTGPIQPSGAWTLVPENRKQCCEPK